MREIQSQAKQKNLNTVCDVVEVSSETLKETIVRGLVSGDKCEKQETRAKVSI